jgi:hypothetical protein
MGVPTSEVGYTSATTGRESMKSIRDMWWRWIKKKKSKNAMGRDFCTLLVQLFKIPLLPIK